MMASLAISGKPTRSASRTTAPVPRSSCSATSKSGSTRTDQAVLAAVAHGYVHATGDDAADLLFRVHRLLALHAERYGGTCLPSGVDVALARFSSVEQALDAGFCLQAEVEQARPAGHHHHKLIALGVSWGSLPSLPDGRRFGPAIARALRLAVTAGPTGGVWIDALAQDHELPIGLGCSEAKHSLQDLLGFRFHHLADYR